MDELEISGKRYISTRRAAREHGYHSDYMGQLIRGKKVTGQKVGRAWYIEEDSLNAYLGKAPVPAPTPKVAPIEEVPAPVIESLVVEETVVPVPMPAPVAVPEPVQPVVEYAVSQPLAAVVEEPRAQHVEIEVQPAVAHDSSYANQEPVPQQAHASAPVAREIHHPPIEEERRVPIHTQAPAPTYASQPQPIAHHVAPTTGGLRYTEDDAPVMPVVHRAQQPRAQASAQYAYAPQPAQSKSAFPYISLSIVAIVTLCAAVFATNFVTATVVTEQGKPATVQYAIHW